ncbi:hypothetical protein GCM10007275_10980 [Jeotgalicoccus coquinae]|uniref:Uncharacterized protein n=1 Tax=Jeotgalicoccus coquinae TaxID=709509 RepID=A0A6V7RMJ2_9STAP|nr:hypothetical protein [Jeotgalicoccus coquinae]MBB6422234.1 hypothetical protein [Jeotgalicoccus coquinae]GGE17559.1 hypothetical protein GCM10007275_10980 [Jeotgalicoccus coquinae]CAD2079212.1 hypothetical protein JEOCOQ751_01425 [Jeotgalicoccus coquinae]
MKKVITEAVKLFKRKDVEKDKAYNNNVDQEKVKRNIEAAEERLADPGLTMCQRQEYQKALDGLKKYKKD